MAQCERGEQLASAVQERIGGDHERAGSQLGQGCEDLFELTLGAGSKDMKLQLADSRRRLQLPDEGLREGWARGVDEHRDAGGRRHDLMEQFELLGSQFDVQIADAGCVAAWAVEAGNEPEFDRIDADTEDNRNCCCRFLGGQRAGRARRNNHGDLATDQIGGSGRQSGILAIPVALDGYVSSLMIAEFIQTLVERAQAAHERVGQHKETDQRQRRLLGARRHRPRRRTTKQGNKLAPFQFVELHTMPRKPVAGQNTEMARGQRDFKTRLDTSVKSIVR
jgi:hypothetical protein